MKVAVVLLMITLMMMNVFRCILTLKFISNITCSGYQLFIYDESLLANIVGHTYNQVISSLSLKIVCVHR